MKYFTMMDFSDTAKRYLEQNGIERAERSVDVDIVLTSFNSVFSHFPNLKLIGCPMTDASHLNVPDGVSLLTLKNAPVLKNVYATAEHTMFLIFNALRPNAFVTDTFERPPEPYRELKDKWVFIFGNRGRVATQVIEMLKGFGCEVDGWDKKKETRICPESYRTADIILSCIDNDPKNANFFGKWFFRELRSDSIFVNIARGSVVDEEALLSWLLKNPKATAMLDVIKEENRPEHSTLLRYKRKHELFNLLLTPHVGGYTKESREKTDMYIAEQIVEWVNERK